MCRTRLRLHDLGPGPHHCFPRSKAQLKKGSFEKMRSEKFSRINLVELYIASLYIIAQFRAHLGNLNCLDGGTKGVVK